MPKETRSDSIKLAERIRAVQEWIIDDWSRTDIIAQCVHRWGITDRQASNYIKAARKAWNEQEDEKIEAKKKRRLASLYKLKRKMEAKYQGTPQGVGVLLKIEQTIIELEGLKNPIKIESSGPDGGPIPTETTHRVIFENYGK